MLLLSKKQRAIKKLEDSQIYLDDKKNLIELDFKRIEVIASANDQYVAEYESIKEQYEKLLYGTKENDFYLNRQKTDGTIESLFSLEVLEFENDNVIRLPKNKSCEIKLTAGNEVLNAKITIYPRYRAV